MTETVVLKIPEALYQRLVIAAGATRLSLEDIILQALQIGSPPTWDDVPDEFQADLASLDRLDDQALWQVSQSHKSQSEQERYEFLLDKQQDGELDASEKLELNTLRREADLFMLRKAQSVAILKWRGKSISQQIG
jgi:hypothetical protein